MQDRFIKIYTFFIYNKAREEIVFERPVNYDSYIWVIYF